MLMGKMFFLFRFWEVVSFSQTSREWGCNLPNNLMKSEKEVLRNLSYELHWSEWVHQWAESNTRMSTPLQYFALSSIRSKCKILLFLGPFFNSTSSGAQLNSIDVSKSCIWILYTSVIYNWMKGNYYKQVQKRLSSLCIKLP